MLTSRIFSIVSSLSVLEAEKQDLSELQTAISELKTNLSALDSQDKVLSTDLAEWRGKVTKLRSGTFSSRCTP